MKLLIKIVVIAALIFSLASFAGCGAKECSLGCGNKADSSCEAEMCDDCCEFWAGFNGCDGRH